MTTQLTSYTFLVKTSDIGGGRDGMDPSYEKRARKFGTDAQAELFANRLSEDRSGAWVTIKRGAASWKIKDYRWA